MRFFGAALFASSLLVSVEADHHVEKKLSASEEEVWNTVKTYAGLWDKRDDGFMTHVHPQYLGWNYVLSRPHDADGLREVFRYYQKEGAGLGSAKHTLTGIRVVDDVALVHYDYQNDQDSGKWTDILKKEGDKWWLISDRGNPNSPDQGASKLDKPIGAKPDAEDSALLEDYGARNPNAPKELAVFEFLIGRWVGDVKLRGEDGKIHDLNMTWVGRYVLDGYAIEEEVRIQWPDGSLFQLGKVLRSFNGKSKEWTMKWYDATKQTWDDLISSDQPMKVTKNSVIFGGRAPVEQRFPFRIKFTNITKSSFSWSSEHTEDNGETWKDYFLRFKVRRVESGDSK